MKRVIVWSSGNVGAHAIRAILDRPDLKLVGVHTYTPTKAGTDAGVLVGVDAVGVRATSDVDLLVRRKADVVIHTPLPSLVYGADPDEDLDVICRMLASGKDVITTVGYLYPKVHGPAVVRRLERACRAGGASFHGTGLNPGWLGELVPLTMAALVRRIDQVVVTEISDFARYPSPEIMLGIMGFGKRPVPFKRQGARRKDWLDGLFRESIAMMADGLGLTLDRIGSTVELDLADAAYDVAAGTIGAGTVAGQRWRWVGRVGRREAIVHETVWRMGPSAGASWPTGPHRVEIMGEPAMRLEFPDGWLRNGLQGTALHAVNAIDAVHAAAPGIRTFLDLPLITGRMR
jgi:hypothetical protein